MSTSEVGRLRGAGLQRWGSYVTAAGCMCCAEGLGLAVGKAWGPRTPPVSPLRATGAWQLSVMGKSRGPSG